MSLEVDVLAPIQIGLDQEELKDGSDLDSLSIPLGGGGGGGGSIEKAPTPSIQIELQSQSGAETVPRTSTFIPFNQSQRWKSDLRDEMSSQISDLTMSVDVDMHYKNSAEELENTEVMIKLLANQLLTASKSHGGLGTRLLGHGSWENRSEMSDLSCSHELNNEIDRNVDLFSLDNRATRNVQQRLRALFVRNSAYERAIKLAHEIDMDEDEDGIDQSQTPTSIAIFLSILSLVCYIPFAVRIARGGNGEQYVGTPIESALKRAAFSNALCFALGTTAPLFTELISNARSICFTHSKFQDANTSFLQRTGLTRIFISLTVALPCIAMLIMIDLGISVASLYASTFFWQYAAIGAVGSVFFSKFKPKLMSCRMGPKFGQLFYLITSVLFTTCNILQAVATCAEKENFLYYNQIAIPFQVGSALMFAAILSRFGLEVYHDLHSTNKASADGTHYGISPINQACASVVLGFSLMLLLDYAVLLVPMSNNPADSDVFSACWHVYVKSIIIILLGNLPLNVAKQRIRKTKGALELVLSLSLNEESRERGRGEEYGVPLYVSVGPDEDNSVGYDPNHIPHDEFEGQGQEQGKAQGLRLGHEDRLDKENLHTTQ